MIDRNFYLSNFEQSDKHKQAISHAILANDGKIPAWRSTPIDMLDSRKEESKARWNAELTPFSGIGDFDINVFTAFTGRVLQQRNLTVNISDYVDIVIGERPFSEITYAIIENHNMGNYKESFIPSSHLGKVNTVNATLNKYLVSRHYWANMIEWSMLDQMVLGVINYQYPERLMRIQRLAWDLMMQEVVMYGLSELYSHTPSYGLLNNPNVLLNTTLAPKPVSEMTPQEFQSLVTGAISLFGQNNMLYLPPNTVIVPWSEYISMQGFVSPEFPSINKLQYFTNVLRSISGDPAAQILANPYSDKVVADKIPGSNLTGNRYVIYRKDPDVLYFDLPIDFSSLMVGTANGGFSFSHYVYGQVGGNVFFRPNNMLYIDVPPPNTGNGSAKLKS